MSQPRRFEPSQEQIEVIRAGERRLMVRAAAGAGKTAVLVQRFLKHVQEDLLNADQILTITFTRKAAAEMKNRIVGALAAAGHPEQAQLAETGPIQTIHGFCQRLLQENALEAGLDPEFEVLDEVEGSRLQRSCIQEAIAFPPEGQVEAAALISSLTGRARHGTEGSPEAFLSAAIETALKSLRSCGTPMTDILSRQGSAERILEYWNERLLEDLAPALRQAVLASDAAQPMALRLRQATQTVEGRPPFAPRSEADAKKQASLESSAARDAAGLIQLACLAWDKLVVEMRRRQAIDFPMLEAEAIALLERSESARRRVQAQFSVVLVDEAQDLNPLQYHLLDLLAIDTEMMVGDAQQSIYGFRQAEVRLFHERIEQRPTKRLSSNYRSDAGLLAFIDTLFGRMWSANYAPMGSKPDPSDFEADPAPDLTGTELWLLQQEDLRQVADWVREMHESGERLRDIAVVTRWRRTSLSLLEHFESLGVPARVVGGTERFYARLEIRDMANALRSLADPYDDFSLLALLRSPLVGLSLDSIVLLAARPPVFEALQDFSLGSLEDLTRVQEFREWFEPLARYVDRLPAWEALAETFARSGYLAKLARRHGGPQLIANVRKLLRVASREPELGPTEFAEQIRGIQQIDHHEGDAPATDDGIDAVTIMTIHKAKGLEFPVVVVPDLYHKLDGRTGPQIADPWLGTLAANYDGQSGLHYAWLAERKRSRERAEEERVLYVALTRAQRRLCVCASPAPTGRNFAGRISELLAVNDRQYPGLVLRKPVAAEDPAKPDGTLAQ